MSKDLEHWNNDLEEYPNKKKTNISSEMKRLAEKSIIKEQNAIKSKQQSGIRLIM